MITIFTPTYNRAYMIKNLYDSLKSQIFKDFEWLIVDDGSTDNTEELILEFITEKIINIRYFRQSNGGKHRAINKGVNEANGELFFIVDSDDFLPDDSLEKIALYSAGIINNTHFAGVSGRRANYSKKREIMGSRMTHLIIDSSPIDIRFRHNVTGDLAEVFKTDVLKEFPFPEFEGERFCPEALVWNRIARKYIIRYFDEPIYFCEYLPDGLTAKIARLRMESPKASTQYYSELYNMAIPLTQKIKAALNYWRFSLCLTEPFRKKLSKIGLFTIVLYPFGLLLHFKDSRS